MWKLDSRDHAKHLCAEVVEALTHVATSVDLVPQYPTAAAKVITPDVSRR